MNYTIARNKPGNAIIYSVVIGAILFTVSLTLTNSLLNSFQATANISLANESFFAAEGGIEQGIYAMSGQLPGYQPTNGTVAEEMDNRSELEWTVSNRIYDYTLLPIPAGESYTIPLFYGYVDAVSIEEAKINPDWFNFNIYYHPDITATTTTCPAASPGDISGELADMTGDFRISYWSEPVGLVKEGDYDEGNDLDDALSETDFTNNSNFCFVENDDEGSGDYGSFNLGDQLVVKVGTDGTYDYWYNISSPSGVYYKNNGDLPDAGELPNDCFNEDGDPLNADDPDNVGEIWYKIDTLKDSGQVVVDRNYYISTNNTVDPGDTRITPYFDPNTPIGTYVDYDADNDDDLDMTIGDAGFFLLVEEATCEEDNTEPGTFDRSPGCNSILALIDGKYYQIFPEINLYAEEEDPTGNGYVAVNDIKGTGNNFKKNFTLYVDVDDNNIVNPNVLARWTIDFQTAVPVADQSAIRNYTTSNEDEVYWTTVACENTGSYEIQDDTDANAGDYQNAANHTYYKFSDFSSGLYIAPYITFTAYQNTLLAFDPDPTAEIADPIINPGEGTPVTPFLPAPYIILESRGFAGGVDGQFTEQVLRTRLEQSENIAIFSHTVVF